MFAQIDAHHIDARSFVDAVHTDAHQIDDRHIDARQFIDNRITQTDTRQTAARVFADNRITAVDQRQEALLVDARQAAVVDQRQQAIVLDQRTQMMTCLANIGVDLSQNKINMTQTQLNQLNTASQVNNVDIDLSDRRRIQALLQDNRVVNIYPDGG